MSIIGLIEGAAEITAGILKGYFGALSDRLGKRSIFVMLGYGLSAIVKPMPGFLPNLSAVVISRISDRVGKGIRTAPRDALLASEAKQNTGAVFGFHRSMDTFGAVAGPLVAILILYLFPGKYTWVFVAAALPSLLAIIFTFTIKDPPKTEKVSKEKHYKEFWKAAPKDYKLFLLLIILFSLANSSDVFLILKSMDISKSDTTAILGYVFYNFIYAMFSYPIGLAADKVGKKNIFIIGLLVYSLVYFGFAFIEDLGFIWILFALYGIYSASTEGVAKAWVSDLIPDKFRGSAIGLLTMLTSLSIMSGSILAGVLWDYYGSTIPFLISAIVSLIVASALYFYKRR